MLEEFTTLMFPESCSACGKTTNLKIEHICITCLAELPRTNFYKSNQNEIEKKFWGRFQFERATSFLYFQHKGKVQHLIHLFKYKGKKEIGIVLGSWAAAELAEDGFFDGIDLLVPIPIHSIKKEVRGYNQSDFLVNGINLQTGIEAAYMKIKKQNNTGSQTRKSRFKRWKNVKSSFRVLDPSVFEGKHVLLVDDVITTGATIEAVAIELLKIPNVKLSILSMAITY